MEEQEFEEWVAQQRAQVGDYLRAQGISDPNVGQWPAFEVAPVFAIWAVESKKAPGRIGWWAFSGDCPTDHVSEDGQCHPRAALRRLIDLWRSYVPSMKRGEQPAEVTIGDTSQLRELGELLEKRVELLSEWVADDGMWEDR